MHDNPWVRRTKWLTQALIISGTLNIGLTATFAYFVLKEKQEALTSEQKPALKTTATDTTNAQLLHAYSLLPYQELLLRLESKRPPRETASPKRDLALACLTAYPSLQPRSSSRRPSPPEKDSPLHQPRRPRNHRNPHFPRPCRLSIPSHRTICQN